jgi:hypothetical protein
MYIDSGFSKRAKHYDHKSEVDAEKCAWEHIAALRKERNAGWLIGDRMAADEMVSDRRLRTHLRPV